MFRAFAITIAVALAASYVLWQVVEQYVQDEDQILPALPQWVPSRPVTDAPDHEVRYAIRSGDTLQAIGQRFYQRPDAWRRIAAANQLMPPYLIRVGQRLVLPGIQPDPLPALIIPEPAPSPIPESGLPFLLRVLLAFLMVSAVLGGIILDQAARVLDVPHRGIPRGGVAMTLCCVVFLSAVVIAWGLVFELGAEALSWWLALLLFLALLSVVALTGVLGVLRYAYHTTVGKSLFLLVSYRFAFVFSFVITGVACWLVLSGWLVDGVETVSGWIRHYRA